MRDLYRPGSGMTFRRLWVLVRTLPAEARVWAALRAAEEKALKPTPEKIRERQAYYDRLGSAD